TEAQNTKDEIKETINVVLSPYESLQERAEQYDRLFSYDDDEMNDRYKFCESKQNNTVVYLVLMTMK
uniref:hypothetical protein n=1 Tax=Proteus faecis TaxID=2050967 RepID=UPI003075E4D4